MIAAIKNPLVAERKLKELDETMALCAGFGWSGGGQVRRRSGRQLSK